MQDYEDELEQYLIEKLSENEARQARLQNLDGVIRQELTMLEKEQDRLHTALALLSQSERLNPVSSFLHFPSHQAFLESDDN